MHKKPAAITRAFLLSLPWLACALPAAAHPGHGMAGFATALGHPFSGADHLLAMVLVGVWAAMSGGPAATLLPAGFVVGLALGAVAGAAGIILPGVEPGVALSLVVLGVLCATARVLPLRSAALVTAGMGLLHGNVHGIELGATWPALIGMLAGSALLHGAGLLLGRQCTGTRGVLLRLFAGLAAIFGLWAA